MQQNQMHTAEAALVTAAYAAIAARQRFGERSREYAQAVTAMKRARVAFVQARAL